METHAGFVGAAYAVTGLVLLGMLVAILLDHRRQVATIAMLADRLGRGGGRLPAASSPGRGDDDEP